MAGAAWLAVVLAGAVAVVLIRFSLRGGAARHTTLAANGQVAAIVALVQRHDYAGQERQPPLLLLAVFSPLIRILDATISLYSVPAAWLSVSNGRWKSPARRVGSATAAALPAAGRLARGSDHAGTKDEPGRPAQVAEASHVSG